MKYLLFITLSFYTNFAYASPSANVSDKTYEVMYNKLREKVYAQEYADFIEQTSKLLNTEGLRIVSNAQMLSALGLKGKLCYDKKIISKLEYKSLPQDFAFNKKFELFFYKKSLIEGVVYSLWVQYPGTCSGLCGGTTSVSSGLKAKVIR